MNIKTAVIYLRASTNSDKQSNSVNYQRALLTEWANRHNYRICDEFVEYASGRDDDREGLENALQTVIAQGAVLIVHRVDRLSRSLSYWSNLQDRLSYIRIMELGDSVPNIFVMSSLLALAQAESENTSIRIKNTIAHLRATKDDFRWGGHNIKEIQPLGAAATHQKAVQFNDKIRGLALELNRAGYSSIQSIADRLNDIGILTRSNKRWSYHNLRRVINAL